MMTIDKALTLYTNKINTCDNCINLEYFRVNLLKKDYDEFLKLIGVVDLLNNYKNSLEFKSIFKKINNYKKVVYGI